MLPWVVLRDLGSSVRDLVFRKRTRDDKEAQTKDDWKRMKIPPRPGKGFGVTVDETLGKGKKFKPVITATMSIVRPPEPLVNPNVDVEGLQLIKDRIRDRFPEAKPIHLAFYSGITIRNAGQCDLCGCGGIRLIAFMADFTKPNGPYCVMEKLMCQDFEACDIRCGRNDVGEEAS
jgi:hypothetical protein